ncbi:O-antigen ligase family protein [Pseudoalteromonas sp. PPB1]|uniref:O-antigen ligase family protein n=1 Tax=Pseudoalteromonas sp. PPB1 TaxID=2756136 RepID=UPI003A5C3FED
MFLLENIQLLSALVLIASFLVYFTTGINFIFSIVMLLNPYVAALLCFSKIFFNYFNFNKVSFSRKNIIFFLLIMSLLFIPYFFSVFNARAMTQLVQFLILSFIFIVFIMSGKPIIRNPSLLLNNLRYSCIILCLLKVVSIFLGVDDFYMFGKNEDAMLIVLAGLGSSLYFYLRNKSYSIIFDFIIYMYAISLYESRSALFFIIVTPFIVIFGSVFKDKERILNKIYLISFFLIFFVISFFSIDYVISAFGLDQTNNYSNLERLGMYIFTYDFIFSGNYLGLGIGNLDLAMESMYVNKYILDVYPHPHSSFLRFTLELGLLGVAAYSFFLIYLLKISFNILAIDKCIGTLLLFFSSSIFYFSLFDSIFYSFFRGIVCLLVLCAFVSLKYEKN